jgi:hypothetical protein
LPKKCSSKKDICPKRHSTKNIRKKDIRLKTIPQLVLFQYKIRPIGADTIKLFFFANNEFLRFFAAKLGHFTISDFFLYVQNTLTKQGKLENEEKKFF